MCLYVYICVFIYVFICVYKYICEYVYIYTCITLLPLTTTRSPSEVDRQASPPTREHALSSILFRWGPSFISVCLKAP
ncbi:hypothetical protein B484DRAFT_39007 [Ochromonadaceae sp. CCMP2298]|nr:hypothetical protein B484DRAFT_39007 [Ochromonadaceae sp. CCMP2298]